MSKKENTKQTDPSVEKEEQVTKKARKRSGSKELKLRQEIADLTSQLEESKDKHLRLFAEFDNFKKRTIKEKIEFMSTAARDTMQALLPILDDFDRAKKAADDENSNEQFSEGVSLLYTKMYAVLEGKGLKPMESNGETFDPELHEAITEIPAPSDDLKGRIVDTVEKGYLLKDKIIRHAKVVVGK